MAHAAVSSSSRRNFSSSPASRRLRPAMLSLSIAAAFASMPLASQNLPVFNKNVHGTAAVSVSNGQMLVTTTNGAGTNHSATNWNSFSIGAGHGVNIVQPNAQSLSINRVVTQVPSQIFGTLGSNGKVVLVNQSGITVGRGAVVDTAGFTASVLGMTEADAAAGRLRFGGDGTSGPLRVEGRIYSRNGDVVLIGKEVEVGKTEYAVQADGTRTAVDGVIEAKDGTVILAAGRQVEITGRGLEGIHLQVQAPSDKAVNLGTLKGDAVGIFAGQLRHSGLIQARSATVEGGRVVLKAQELAEVNGRIEAARTVDGRNAGGAVEIAARVVTQNGGIDVRGQSGGTVNIAAQTVLQGGQIDAGGSAGGGTIVIVARKHVEQTAGAKLAADGGEGAGGTVHVQATEAEGTVLSSAELSADGATGGEVRVFAPTVRLLAAKIHAEGTAESDGHGGSIKVGGGRQGNDPDAPNSRHVFINAATLLSASSRRSGRGGNLIVWSDGITTFAGNAFARGGSERGDGGFIEVSGKEKLSFSGMANAGAPHGARGTLLLDPKNIVIDNNAGGTLVAQGIDPDPETTGTGDFGHDVREIGGRLVVTDPLNDVTATDAGAIYVFDRATGAFIGALRGSHANDKVGEAVTGSPFATHELVLTSTNWDAAKGAVTFLRVDTFSGSGVVSDANSFVGAAAGDRIGSDGFSALHLPGATAALFGSPDWAGGKGAIFKVMGGPSGMTGLLDAGGALRAGGIIDSSLALTGKAATDRIGAGLRYGTNLWSASQDQFLLTVPQFDGDKGAVVLANVQHSLRGEIGNTAANLSLTGSTTGDRIGDNVIQTSSGDWLVVSPGWNNGAAVKAGAISFVRAADAGNLGTPTNGAVSALNSLVGTNANDAVGSDVRLSSDGSHMLSAAPSWNDGRGAVTWKSLAGPFAGAIGATNSLVGANVGDLVGENVFTYHGSPGAEFVIGSPSWNYFDGATLQAGAGALTVIPAAGVTGVVSSANSLIGTHAGDGIGATVVSPGAGSYILSVAPSWDGNKGAVTYVSLTSTATGVVNSANSLVGGFAGDRIGAAFTPDDYPLGNWDYLAPGTGVQFLDHGYLVRAPQWNADTGMVAFGAAAAGVSGTLDAANAQSIALVGQQAGDFLGRRVGLGSNGNYLVVTPLWNGGHGAVTWGDGMAGVKGLVSSANSLTGSENSHYGNLVHNVEGKLLVRAPDWSSDYTLAPGMGAFTLLDFDTAPAALGAVGAANSVVGSAANDKVGQYGPEHAGNDWYAMRSPGWTGSSGAVTFINPSGAAAASAPKGAIAAWETTNLSVVGSHADNWVAGAAGDRVGGTSVQYAGDGRIFMANPGWKDNRGAVTLLDLNGMTSSFAVSDANSLVGSNPGDSFGQYAAWSAAGTHVIAASTSWGGDKGAVAVTGWGSAMRTGYVGTANALVGTQGYSDGAGSAPTYYGDRVGSNLIQELGGEHLIVVSPHWGDDQGALTVSSFANAAGAIGSGNSLVGGQPNTYDAGNGYTLQSAGGQLGGGTFSGKVIETGGKVVVASPEWGGNRGAISWIDPASPGGTLDTGSNTLIGSVAGDMIGSGGFVGPDAGTGGSLPYNLALSASWAGGKGAITKVTGTATPGTLGAANSFVGGTPGDQVGANLGCYSSYCDNVVVFGNGAMILRSGESSASGGGYTVFAPGSQVAGVLDATTSVTGSPADFTGAYLFTNNSLGDRALLMMPNWSGGMGAVRVLDTGLTASAGVTAAINTGATGAANALVGSAAGDEVGSGFSTYYPGPALLGNGRVLIMSRHWSGDLGAVTVLDAANPLRGLVSSANSLVGGSVDDFGGTKSLSYEAPHLGLLSNGDFLLGNQYFGGGQGSVTYFNLGGATVGVLGADGKSMYGGSGSTAGYFAFSGLGGGVYDSSIGNYRYGSYLVKNVSWMGGRGMATVFNAGVAGNPLGNVGGANALVGTNAGDGVGGGFSMLTPSVFMVGSANWNGGRGALTWGSVTGGAANLARGEVSASNSLVGVNPNDHVGALGGEGSVMGQLAATPGTFYILTAGYNGNQAIYTFVNAGATGSITSHNTVYSGYANSVSSYDTVPEYLGNGLYRLQFSGASQGASGPGQIVYTNAVAGGSGGYAGGLGFGDAPAHDVTISTQRITDIVNGGTDIQLQANNDIVVNSAIAASGGPGGVGGIHMQAGRSIRLNAGIDTAGGNLHLEANSAQANQAYRDAGAGGISTAAGVTIALGGGEMLAEVGAGGEGGGIHLGTITGGHALYARNLSASAGAGITQEAGTVWGVERLALQTQGAGANIGDASQAVTFDGFITAVRTADGSAHIRHTGAQLFFDDEVSGPPTGGTTADLGENLDPGFRGIVLAGSGSLRLSSGGDIAMVSGGNPLEISARNIDIAAAGDLLFSATGGKVAVLASGDMTLKAQGAITLHGGHADGAHVSVVALRNAKIEAGGALSLHGGSGAGSYALLDPVNLGSTMSISAPEVNLSGGTGAGSYAAIMSQGGPLDLSTGAINLSAGPGANADAVILAPNGQALAGQFACATCGYLGVGNTLLNGSSEAGFGTLVTADTGIQQQLVADSIFMDQFLALYNQDLERRKRTEEGVVFEQRCQ